MRVVPKIFFFFKDKKKKEEKEEKKQKIDKLVTEWFHSHHGEQKGHNLIMTPGVKSKLGSCSGHPSQAVST